MSIRLGLGPTTKIPECYRGKRCQFSDVPNGFVDIDAKGDIVKSTETQSDNLMMPYSSNCVESGSYDVMVQRKKKDMQSLLRRQQRQLKKRGHVNIFKPNRVREHDDDVNTTSHTVASTNTQHSTTDVDLDDIYGTLLTQLPELDFANLFTELEKTSQGSSSSSSTENGDDEPTQELTEDAVVDDENSDGCNSQYDDDDDNDNDDTNHMSKKHESENEHIESEDDDDIDDYNGMDDHNNEMDDDVEETIVDADDDVELDASAFDACDDDQSD